MNKPLSSISEICKFITGKDILLGDSNIVEKEYIMYRGGSKISEVLILHEIGHFIAANPKERKLPNLGLPSKFDNYKLDEHILVKEIMARDFSRILFYDWALKLYSDLGNFEKYANYLFFEIFQDEYENLSTNGISYPCITNIHQTLSENLSQLGLTIDDIKRKIESISEQ